jgi:ABC-type polysaccharide/polyol phosphate export permease
MGNPRTGYFKNNSSHISVRSIFGALKLDLLKSRTIILQLIKRDLYTQFRQQITGALWLVVSPLVSVVGYIIMYSIGILKPGTSTYPYFIFVIIGVGLWSLVTITTATISNSLVSQGELILRTNIPLIAIPLASFGRILLAYISHVTSVLFLMVLFRVPFGTYWLLYPVAALLPVLYGTGFGLITSIWQVVSREIGALVQVGLQICFFATPALFSITLPLHRLGEILKYNPMSYTILTPRSFMLESGPLGLKGFIFSTLIAFALLIIAFIFFYKKSYVIAERL